MVSPIWYYDFPCRASFFVLAKRNLMGRSYSHTLEESHEWKAFESIRREELKQQKKKLKPEK